MTFKTFLAENLVFFFGFTLLLFAALAVEGMLWLLWKAGERWLRERLNLPKDGVGNDDGTIP